MAENLPSLAPYGGITRIRFKGSARSREHSQPLAPPLFDDDTVSLINVNANNDTNLAVQNTHSRDLCGQGVAIH